MDSHLADASLLVFMHTCPRYQHRRGGRVPPYLMGGVCK